MVSFYPDSHILLSSLSMPGLEEPQRGKEGTGGIPDGLGKLYNHIIQFYSTEYYRTYVYSYTHCRVNLADSRDLDREGPHVLEVFG
jgi:hypothetical protein